MDIRKDVSAVGSVISSIFNEVSYAKEITYGVLALLLAVGAFFGYRHISSGREQAAQKVFAAAVEEFERSERIANPNWAEVEELFKLGYEQHSGSVLAPFFLAKQADSLIEQGKKEESIEIIDQAIRALGSSPLLHVYQTKRALIMLDMENAQQQVAGLEALQELAKDTNNPNRDLAGFYLGQYHASRDEFGKARAAWEQLVADQTKAPQSPWAGLAEEMMTLIA